MSRQPRKQITNSKLPKFFKPILWSYNFLEMSPIEHKKSIIIQAINYGDLRHWRWLVKFYGREQIKKTLMSVPATEILPRTRHLASIIFRIKKFNHAPRGT